MDDIIFYFNQPLNSVQDMFIADRITLKKWDEMLAEGWRHNGKMMFRNSHDFDENDDLCRILPLRNRLRGLKFSKSQRKIFSKNQVA